jgi:putative salt-induced outer membrane protein YdiY
MEECLSVDVPYQHQRAACQILQSAATDSAPIAPQLIFRWHGGSGKSKEQWPKIENILNANQRRSAGRAD